MALSLSLSFRALTFIDPLLRPWESPSNFVCITFFFPLERVSQIAEDSSLIKLISPPAYDWIHVIPQPPFGIIWAYYYTLPVFVRPFPSSAVIFLCWASVMRESQEVYSKRMDRKSGGYFFISFLIWETIFNSSTDR